MLAFIIILIIVGFFVGLIARAVVPGKDKIGFIGTTLLGIVGSFVGGFLWELVEYHTISTSQFHSVGIIGSIIGAVVVLLILRMTGAERGRSRRRF